MIVWKKLKRDYSILDSDLFKDFFVDFFEFFNQLEILRSLKVIFTKLLKSQEFASREPVQIVYFYFLLTNVSTFSWETAKTILRIHLYSGGQPILECT